MLLQQVVNQGHPVMPLSTFFWVPRSLGVQQWCDSGKRIMISLFIQTAGSKTLAGALPEVSHLVFVRIPLCWYCYHHKQAIYRPPGLPSLRTPSQGKEGGHGLCQSWSGAAKGQEKRLIPSSACCFSVLFFMPFCYELSFLLMPNSLIHSFMCVLQGLVQMPQFLNRVELARHPRIHSSLCYSC